MSGHEIWGHNMLPNKMVSYINESNLSCGKGLAWMAKTVSVQLLVSASSWMACSPCPSFLTFFTDDMIVSVFKWCRIPFFFDILF